jgi:hypothetical protein
MIDPAVPPPTMMMSGCVPMVQFLSFETDECPAIDTRYSGVEESGPPRPPMEGREGARDKEFAR